MNIFCHAITTPAKPASLIAYLSDPANLPEWATEFCQKLTTTDDGYRILTPMGVVAFSTVSCTDTGIVDMITRADDAPEQGVLPTRVTPLPGGGSSWTVTFAQTTDMPDVMFAGQCESIRHEMANVAGLFANHSMAG